MQVQIFKNKDFGKIRVIGDFENPLFCLKDVCRALEIKRVNSARDSINSEFNKGGVFDMHPFKTLGGIQNFIMVNEPELYFLLMRSDKPNAKSFRQWVINKVLPSIRKKGYYFHPQKLQRQLEIPESIPYRDELANLINALSHEEGVYFNRLKRFSIDQYFDEDKNEREIHFRINVAEIIEPKSISKGERQHIFHQRRIK